MSNQLNNAHPHNEHVHRAFVEIFACRYDQYVMFLNSTNVPILFTLQGLSPTEILEGYEKAMLKACEILPDLVCHTVKDVQDETEVCGALRTCLMSKQHGHEDFLAGLVAKACIEAHPAGNEQAFNVDHVRVVKVPGQGILSSSVLKGMIFKREAHGTTNSVEKAVVAVYTGKRSLKCLHCTSPHSAAMGSSEISIFRFRLSSKVLFR